MEGGLDGYGMCGFWRVRGRGGGMGMGILVKEAGEGRKAMVIDKYVAGIGG